MSSTPHALGNIEVSKYLMPKGQRTVVTYGDYITPVVIGVWR